MEKKFQLSATMAPSGRTVTVSVPITLVRMPVARIVWTIPANDAFVLNRLAAGDRTIGELLQLCPMTEREVLSVVQRYLKQQLLIRKS